MSFDVWAIKGEISIWNLFASSSANSLDHWASNTRMSYAFFSWQAKWGTRWFRLFGKRIAEQLTVRNIFTQNSLIPVSLITKFLEVMWPVRTTKENTKLGKKCKFMHLLNSQRTYASKFWHVANENFISWDRHCSFNVSHVDVEFGRCSHPITHIWVISVWKPHMTRRASTAMWASRSTVHIDQMSTMNKSFHIG